MKNMSQTRFLNKISILFLVLLLITGCSAASSRSAIIKSEKAHDQLSGINGKVVLEEKYNYIENAYVFAYTGIDFDSSKYFISEPTAKDGSYRLYLPEGQYYIVAKKSSRGRILSGNPGKNDYFSYYGGNPVVVKKNEFFFIGLNCSQKKTNKTFHKSKEQNKSGITGKATYKNQPLEGAYILVFENAENNFRGSFYSISDPTDKEGIFSVDLPPGKYYILAKKMKQDEEPYIHPYGKGKILERVSITAGPLKQGDYHYYYNENPVEVKENFYTSLELPCTVKISDDDKTYYNISTGKMRIEGRVVDENNKPVANVYAFASTNRLMEEKPEYLSNPTKADGSYVLYIKKPGWYYIGARDYLGRPMRRGDLFGYYNQVGNNIIKVTDDDIIKNITIGIALVE